MPEEPLLLYNYLLNSDLVNTCMLRGIYMHFSEVKFVNLAFILKMSKQR
jgi:hypothetical protein